MPWVNYIMSQRSYCLVIGTQQMMVVEREWFKKKPIFCMLILCHDLSMNAISVWDVTHYHPLMGSFTCPSLKGKKVIWKEKKKRKKFWFLVNKSIVYISLTRPVLQEYSEDQSKIYTYFFISTLSYPHLSHFCLFF